MFWAVISVVGQTWHRMVRPYTLPPWNLARLVAYEEPLESKQACVWETTYLLFHVCFCLRVLCLVDVCHLFWLGKLNCFLSFTSVSNNLDWLIFCFRFRVGHRARVSILEPMLPWHSLYCATPANDRECEWYPSKWTSSCATTGSVPRTSIQRERWKLLCPSEVYVEIRAGEGRFESFHLLEAYFGGNQESTLGALGLHGTERASCRQHHAISSKSGRTKFFFDNWKTKWN